MSQKRMLKVEQEPQKLYSLSLNVQTYNNFILLQISTFLISRYAALVCGAVCQPAGLPDVIWPALYTWEVLVGYTLMELGRKQAVSSLTDLSISFVSDEFLYSEMVLFPLRPFLFHSILCDMAVPSAWHKKLMSLLCCLPSNLWEHFSFKTCRHIADANCLWKLAWLFRLVIVLEDR